MVGVLGPVRRMQVDGHVRVVFGEEPRHRPRLRRVELHVIAVQVVALGIGALPHPAEGSVLAAAVGEGHPLIAVRVVDGPDEQDHRLPPFAVATGHDVPQQHLERLLPAHLAGVDVALEINDCPAGSPDRGRTRIRDVAHYGEGKRPSLVGIAECGVVDRRRGGRRALQEVHDIGVGAGLAIVRAFRAREKRVVGGRGALARREHGREDGEAAGKRPRPSAARRRGGPLRTRSRMPCVRRSSCPVRRSCMSCC